MSLSRPFFTSTGSVTSWQDDIRRPLPPARRAVELRPHYGAPWRTLAAAAGLAGDRDTASHALSEAKRLQPSLSVDWIERYHPLVRSEDRARFIDGLRKAGLT